MSKTLLFNLTLGEVVFSHLIPAFVSLTSPSARQQGKLCFHIFSLPLVRLASASPPRQLGSPSLGVPLLLLSPAAWCCPCAALHVTRPGPASWRLPRLLLLCQQDCGPRRSWGLPIFFWRMVQKPPRVYKSLQVLCYEVPFFASI